MEFLTKFSDSNIFVNRHNSAILIWNQRFLILGGGVALGLRFCRFVAGHAFPACQQNTAITGHVFRRARIQLEEWWL